MEAQLLQGSPREAELVVGEREVEVGVIPRRLTCERVDAPAAVHDHVDAGGLEPVENFYNVSCVIARAVRTSCAR